MDPKQLAVYEEFARNVPGFLPSNDLSQPTGFLAQPMKVGVSNKKIVKTTAKTVERCALQPALNKVLFMLSGKFCHTVFWSFKLTKLNTLAKKRNEFLVCVWFNSNRHGPRMMWLRSMISA